MPVSPTNHPAFDEIRAYTIEHLNLEIKEYVHKVTQAKHFHMATSHNENVFLVAFRTMPMDSTGVAHILEHTALCGSRRYPVRDPFFMMLRRSLNTFMNAFTSGDWTAYPFASQNRKDYFNLLSIYLDAAFFSRLDPLDFAQEGHRLEFKTATDATSPLEYKGVVFNEMKGAMSSTNSQLADLIGRYLFPSNTYHYNSGGDPAHIPDLSYEALQHFYQSHYHPSNALFFTYGDIPVFELQEKMQTQVLAEFTAAQPALKVEPEKRYHAPIEVVESYGIEANDSTEDKTFIAISWLLGDSTDPLQRLEAHLLSQALLANSASPLQQLLENFSHAKAPLSLSGLDDSQKEMVFSCGVEGSNPQHNHAFLQQVLQLLTRLAEEGIDYQQLESVCHQIELSQREIGGDHYPYGLQLILTALPGAIHHQDPVKLLDIDPYLIYLREQIQNPDYIKTLIRRWLLDNHHRLLLTVKPDTGLNQRRQAAEEQRLQAIQKQLTAQQQQAIIQLSQQLLARQQQTDDADILPKVGLEDVAPQLDIPTPTEQHQSPPLTYFRAGTNGLAYVHLLLPVPTLAPELWQQLPLFCKLSTEVGVGQQDYLATQAWQARVSGGISLSLDFRSDLEDAHRTHFYCSYSSKALTRNQSAMLQLLGATYRETRWDEATRIQELITQRRVYKEKSIPGQGHSLAMLAASSGFNPALHFSHQVSGLKGLQALQQLDDGLQQDAHAFETLQQQFQTIQQALIQQPVQLLYVSDSDWQTLKPELQAFANQQTYTKTTGPVLSASAAQQAWLTNTQVNFCAQAFATVPASHADSAALTVLGAFLKNGYLHRAIREQGGAYGGGASHDAGHAVFKFYSYRDPRLQGTLDDFHNSIDWLLNTHHSADSLEQAILGIISGIDKPGSPAGMAIQAYYDQLFARTPEHRNAYRQRILAVTIADLKRVGEIYLSKTPRTAVITHQAAWQQFAGASAFDTQQL
jgi:hypothetical protein